MYSFLQHLIFLMYFFFFYITYFLQIILIIFIYYYYFLYIFEYFNNKYKYHIFFENYSANFLEYMK